MAENALKIQEPDDVELLLRGKGRDGQARVARRERLREVEAMIDESFRKPEVMKKMLTKCQEYGFTHITGLDITGNEILLRAPDAAFAKMFFDRVMGIQVKEEDTFDEMFADAPDEVLIWIRKKRSK